MLTWAAAPTSASAAGLLLGPIVSEFPDLRRWPALPGCARPTAQYQGCQGPVGHTPTAPGKVKTDGCKMSSTRLVSSEPVAAPPIVPLGVRYVGHGKHKQMQVPVTAPTRFDRVLISITEQTLPRMPLHGSGKRRSHQLGRRWIAARSNSPVLDLRHQEPNNVAHLLLHLIPFALYASQQCRVTVTILTRPITSTFRPLLEMFGGKRGRRSCATKMSLLPRTSTSCRSS